jgi:hypothetical protein
MGLTLPILFPIWSQFGLAGGSGTNLGITELICVDLAGIFGRAFRWGHLRYVGEWRRGLQRMAVSLGSLGGSPSRSGSAATLDWYVESHFVDGRCDGLGSCGKYCHFPSYRPMAQTLRFDTIPCRALASAGSFARCFESWMMAH